MSILKTWAAQDQPRNKMIVSGCSNLSTTELLSIILNTGTKDSSAIELAKFILKEFGGIKSLSKKSLNDLKKIKGVGESKASSVIAAFELGRRNQLSDALVKTKLTTSNEAYNILAPLLAHLTIEQFKVILLNRSNMVKSIINISTGGVAGTVVDAKVIFKHALDHLASGIILSHNHPSGNLKPSQQDISITKKLVEAGKNLDINVLDHLIISDLGYFSFKDEGLI